MFGTQFYTEKVYWNFLHFNCSISISFLRMIGGFFGRVIWKTGVLKWKKNKRGKTDQQNWLQISSFHLLNYIILLSYFLDHFFLALFVTFLIIILRFLSFFFSLHADKFISYTLKRSVFFLSFGGTGGVATFSRGESINIPAAGIVFLFGKASCYNVLFIVFVFLYPTFVSLVCFLGEIQSRKSWWAVVKSGTF